MPLGLPSGTVIVVPYDTRWPALYAAVASEIRAALPRDLPLALEHIGSTAVPGLAAKPIIDISAGHPPGADLPRYIDAIVRAGFEHRGENGIPGREFFRRGDPRSYHLHLSVLDGPFWREHLLFRDTLRAHDAERDAYAALKLELARRFPFDRPSYIDGKTEFVRDLLRRHGAR